MALRGSGWISIRRPENPRVGGSIPSLAIVCGIPKINSLCAKRPQNFGGLFARVCASSPADVLLEVPHSAETLVLRLGGFLIRNR
jgi:hypothetical protein